MRLGLMLAITAGAVILPLSASVWAAEAHGPTTIVKHHPDGTHTVIAIGRRDTYRALGSEEWGGFIKREAVVRDTYQHVNWGN